ncbi:MAG: hypothetical protein ACXVRV_09045, partial [Gaiellaceae bacterium]
MLRRRVGGLRLSRWRELAAFFFMGGSLCVCVIAVIAGRPDRVNALSVVLGVAAVGAGLMVAGTRGGLSISAAFIVSVLAAAFLGPASAVAAALISEVAASLRLRTAARDVLF